MLRKPIIDYMEALRLPRGRRIIELACQNLAKLKFDVIAFTGISGAMIAPAVAYEMGKGLILIRKPGDKSHALLKVEGYLNADSYVILDDFISTGITVERVTKAIRREAAHLRLAGIYEYHGNFKRMRAILTTQATANRKRADPYVTDLMVELFKKYGA